MGVQVWRIRKNLSVAAVKSQVGCLLSRLGSVGEGSVRRGGSSWRIDFSRRREKERQAELRARMWDVLGADLDNT